MYENEAVVQPPEIDQLRPGAFPVSLRTDPVLLLIMREYKLLDLLRPDEAMVVVYRRA
jgi:hypothetical protein